MQRRFLLALALTVVSLLGSSPVLADEPAAGSVPPEKPKPFAPKWSIMGVTEVRLSLRRTGYNITHGIEVARALGPYVRLGAGLSLPLKSDTYDQCGRPGDEMPCVYNYYALQLIAELHPLPRFAFDPWIRIGAGPNVDVNIWDAFDFRFYHPEWGVMAAGAVGFDFHEGGFVGGVYGTVATFSGKGASLGGLGTHVGGEW